MTGAWIVVVALCIMVGLLTALTISLGGPAGMLKLSRDLSLSCRERLHVSINTRPYRRCRVGA